jgi:hypothetical protein
VDREVVFDHSGMMYLTGVWRSNCRVHEIMARHFLVFNYDEEHTLTVTLFDETMCRRHYMPATLANAVVSSYSAVGYYFFSF